jgi:hypothetical protein
MKEVGVDGDGDPNAVRSDEESSEEEEEDGEEDDKAEEIENDTRHGENKNQVLGSGESSADVNESSTSHLEVNDKT